MLDIFTIFVYVTGGQHHEGGGTVVNTMREFMATITKAAGEWPSLKMTKKKREGERE